MTLDEKLAVLGGKRATPEEIARLRELASPVPYDVLDLLVEHPIIGASFSLAEEDDDSEMGAELRVLSPAEIMDEVTNAYPGIAAQQAGYLPLGACLEGSGDPYFVSIESGQLVRIPHDAVLQDDVLDTAQVEVVRQSFTDFLEAAEPYPS